MSERMTLGLAKEIALEVSRLFADVCESIVVGGSIRREKETVGDIELIVIPKYVEVEVREDLFNWKVERKCLLEARIGTLAAKHAITPRINKNKNKIAWIGGGETRYCAAWVKARQALTKVDFFIVRPDRLDWYGWHLLLRTGPGEANHLLVKEGGRGLLPRGVRVSDGIIYRMGKPFPLATEDDVFKLWGMDYVAPQKRSEAAYFEARAAWEARGK